ncbi:GNAT family N-acetyltransferase [Streptomyces actinomycinicus]|uniref:GNAT family N-acetyltransferase n=1 Tax=Streptomyces actinomycinicus TaxID=1695166 RepID=A0A937JT92_9ACTN|nr:GNAT family N-acetyltransferase [Streptomyces actinomycinicus]MBL1086518.1 GNAT family N-acetyltransferase [Streptomyces actinomycinicus]
MTAQEAASAPRLIQFTCPDEVTSDLRRDLVDCWVAVSNAGGAVIPYGFPPPPVTEREVGPVLDQIADGLDPRRCRMLVATVEGELAGWLILRRDPHPVVAHCGVVNHVQTHLRFRRLGIGAALMHRVRDVARDEMGLARLGLGARAGLGLEEFYRRLGWVEVGRWPGALRVAPGDDRDEILMSLAL